MNTKIWKLKESKASLPTIPRFVKHFNIENHTEFYITNFNINTPVCIQPYYEHTLYLSMSNDHAICFSDSPTHQQWIFEKELDAYYIKPAFPTKHCLQYLGCPNTNNNVHLYTSRNRYTRWQVNDVGEGKYRIQYAGEKFKKNEVQLVVARYTEDVRWVSAYNDIAIIYNKGRPNITAKVDNIIELENIGREGHTYLHHIIENYDRLKDRVIFLQGDPFTHNDTILCGIDNYDRFADIMPLGLGYMTHKNIPPTKMLDKVKHITDYGLNFAVFRINNNGDYHSDNFFNDSGLTTMIHTYASRHGTTDLLNSFLKQCNIHVKTSAPIYFTFSALFSLHKTCIAKYRVEDYRNIMKVLLMENSQGGIHGYILERLWLYMFGFTI